MRAERVKLRAIDPEGLAEAWAMVEGIWTGTVARARKLPEPVLHEQVTVPPPSRRLPMQPPGWRQMEPP